MAEDLSPLKADGRTFQWLTTAANPHVKGYGADDGQRGWKVHAVEASDDQNFAAIRRFKAACGLKPAHGWGSDLFIVTKCGRCVAALVRQFPGAEVETSREILFRSISDRTRSPQPSTPEEG